MSKIAPAEGHEFELHVPVVIIGAGAAGLIAALVAHAQGAEILVLERDHLPRGSTALSAGLVPAAGTRWQAALGIQDNPALFAADIMAKAHNEPDPALVAVLSHQSARALEWLADKYGFNFTLITEFSYPGHSALRMHGLPSRSGAELVDKLFDTCQREAIDVLCDAHVQTLFADQQGRILGLEYQRPDGALESLGCDWLILACNGYGGNRSLVADYIPSLADALYFGHTGNQGDALLWGNRLGAATRHLSGHQGHGSVAHPAGILISWSTITAGGVQVNLHGRRFANEMRGYSEAAADVLAQPEAVAWTIFDERIAAITRQFEDFRQAEAANAILRADTLQDLARAMKIDAPTFLAEMAALPYGSTDYFGRAFDPGQKLAPPFCAVRVTGALFHTQGGLVVDQQARVLREDGSALPNLLAVGGAACGVSGSEARGYLSGNGLLAAVGLGFVAGQTVTQQA